LERELNAGPTVGNPRIAAEEEDDTGATVTDETNVEEARVDERMEAIGIVVRLGRGELIRADSKPGNTNGVGKLDAVDIVARLGRGGLI
jgi:hypothetical protein